MSHFEKYYLLKKDISLIDNSPNSPAFTESMMIAAQNEEVFKQSHHEFFSKKKRIFMQRNNIIHISNSIGECYVLKEWVREANVHEVISARLKGEV